VNRRHFRVVFLECGTREFQTRFDSPEPDALTVTNRSLALDRRVINPGAISRPRIANDYLPPIAEDLTMNSGETLVFNNQRVVVRAADGRSPFRQLKALPGEIWCRENQFYHKDFLPASAWSAEPMPFTSRSNYPNAK
jgi:hypothetical protein